ncbi:putative membrane protein [Litorivivens lipolytica]|uniref:Putative membrane protein n=1 Tax=Litorivivens lipolytica TaxID=1524264 RepID=A0A7W4W7X2_9GAMM|nr:DUF202 domain-containing protein [Litorivivens lipolytica]MBB3048492.1 putative membrane protein [Litorivivens lipolytica]
MDTLRDKLAMERTELANERTFLAYVRTSLSLIAGAAVLFQFFASVEAYVVLAWVLAVFGVVVLLVGIYRFRTVSKKLKQQAGTDTR